MKRIQFTFWKRIYGYTKQIKAMLYCYDVLETQLTNLNDVLTFEGQIRSMRMKLFGVQPVFFLTLWCQKYQFMLFCW